MVLRTAACEWRFLCIAFYGIPTTGRLATAVRFGSRPAPPAGRHLTGQKGVQDGPYVIAHTGDEMNVGCHNSAIRKKHGHRPCA